MAKIEVLDVIEIDGVMHTIKKVDSRRFKNLYPSMVGLTTLTIPSIAFANSDDTFNRIWSSLMVGLDYMATLTIIFAAVSWMLGHRTKAIELLISIACGFVLARHAIDIVDFLKTI